MRLSNLNQRFVRRVFDCRAWCHPAGAQSPSFTERGAIADLDRDVTATRIQFCPKRIGFVEWDRVLGLIMRSETVHRFTRREHATAHVALLTRMVSRSQYFLEGLLPIPHRLAIYLHNESSSV